MPTSSLSVDCLLNWALLNAAISVAAAVLVIAAKSTKISVAAAVLVIAAKSTEISVAAAVLVITRKKMVGYDLL